MTACAHRQTATVEPTHEPDERARATLHNVGNVLTSVGVSVSAIHELGDRLPAEKLRDLADLVAGLDLTDGDGSPKVTATLERVIRYARALAELLARQRDQIKSECRSTIANLGHVAAIIDDYQRSGRSGRTAEHLYVGEVVDEAVRMISGRTHRNAVEIERTIPPSMSLACDRHVLLQILINLLGNAVDAVRHLAERERRVDVTAHGDHDEVVIRISDNGVGIAPERLPTLTVARRTTKYDGHGFGLASCAALVGELGGSLACESPGLDLGASFVLALPRRPIGGG